MPQYWDLSNDHYLAQFLDDVHQRRQEGKRIVVEFVDEHRSGNQNKYIYALYRDIAKGLGDQTEVDVRRECKLRYGISILRTHNQAFREFYDHAIKNSLDYAEKLEAMDFVPVTSLMDKSQCSHYIDTVVREYSGKGIMLDRGHYG